MVTSESNWPPSVPVSKMKKPNKPPPPPPPPPRSKSPARSYTSYPLYADFKGGSGGSDYAASHCSMPISCNSMPVCHCNHYCLASRFETMSCHSGYQPTASACGCANHSPSISTRSLHNAPIHHHSNNSHHHCGAPIAPVIDNELYNHGSGHHHHHHHHHHHNNNHQHQHNHHPTSIPHSHHTNHHQTQHHHQVQQSHNFSHHHQPSRPSLVNKSLPPIPKEKVLRRRISVSPLPRLKNTNQKPREVCEPSHYRRHVEQHLERLFRYLWDREARLRETIHECEDNPQRQTILKVLSSKETRYLRSLRAPIKKSDFQEIQKLGKGYMGEVWLVRKTNMDADSGPSLFAMKKIEKNRVYEENHQNHIMAERDILAEADNDWIVKLFFSFQDEKYLYFILEYLPGGDMMNLLMHQIVFPESWAQFYIAEISVALQYVHDMNFIHRDIKPDNILIDARGHIKLTDFGLCTGFRWTHDSNYYRDDTLSNTADSAAQSNQLDDHPTITRALTMREIEYSNKRKPLSLVGSPNYIAPEVLRSAFMRQDSDERLCDWWSVGVIMYEMIVGFCPFIDLRAVETNNAYNPEDSPVSIQGRIINWKQHLVFPGDARCPSLRKDRYYKEHPVSPAAMDLMRGLLCDPQDRLCKNGLQDIRDHPFFEGIPWTDIRSKRAPYIPELSSEIDTRHFESNFDPRIQEPDNMTRIPSTPERPMNDFTYRSFWTKPCPTNFMDQR